MKVWLKRIGIGIGALILVLAVGGGIFAWMQTSAYDAAMEKVHDVPPPKIERSSDPAVLARGKHIVETVYPCASGDCHGSRPRRRQDPGHGPARVDYRAEHQRRPVSASRIRTGSSRACSATASRRTAARCASCPCTRSTGCRIPTSSPPFPYFRTVPAVSKPNGPLEIKTLAKVLDRVDAIQLEIASRIDREKAGRGPAPSPTKEYGAFLGRACTGCHGKTLERRSDPRRSEGDSGPDESHPRRDGPPGLDVRRLRQGARAGHPKKWHEDRPVHARRGVRKARRDREARALLVLAVDPPVPFGKR